ncbi:MAG TPA: wax ester/triacylglycerol synthase family O-acyltransferase [Solirubrobacteraceae bacterium]|jgi:WS/DGAT/MGAT family acyltransferase
MRQLTAADAQFIAAEDGRTHGHYSGVAIYDPSTAPGGDVTIERLRELVGARLHLVPPFRWRLAEVPLGLDLPYWAEAGEIDLTHHVRERSLPAPGDARALAAVVGEVLSEPLDRSRPLWELNLVRGLPGGRVAIVPKVHHAASDGVGAAELFSLLHDPTPEVREVPGAAPLESDAPTAAGMLARGVLGVARHPARLARSAPRALPHLDQVPFLRSVPGTSPAAGLARRVGRALPGGDGAALEAPRVRAPRTRMSGRITAGRRVAIASTSLDEVKAIKNHFGVTVNDVVMAILAGALRSWLDQLGDLPAAPLVAAVPLSVRTPDERGAYGNRIAMMLTPMPTDAADPVDRLQVTRDAMNAVKARHQTVPATILQDSNTFIPPILLARAARASAFYAATLSREATANLIMSNVPGPREPMYLAGARWEALYPASAIFHGLGLNVTAFSYRDAINWGAVCDPTQVPDVWPLMDAISSAQAELLRRTLP